MGGGNDASSFNSGGRYDPALNSWTATTITGAPTARSGHTAIWSGSEMIVWGGFVSNTGGRYDPALDSWTPTTTTGAPAGRYSHAIWSGREMIIWGGYGGTKFNSGGRYDPVLDSWTATTTTGAPTARSAHTVIWSGSEMIVWGGHDGSLANSGGRYDPALDSWTATPTTGAPTGRYGHTAVWSGSEMIVWGGLNNTGGCYDPALNSWTATTTTGAPTNRWGHTAIWSGSEMIIWGGDDNQGSSFNSGGRYDPALDSWIATTTIGAPTARDTHSAIWSGSEMIVWGGRDNGGGYSDNNVGIYYTYNSYTVGGSVTCLAAGNSVVLQNNGLDNQAINADGGFTFAGALDDGDTYAVTVLTQPNNQTCSVSNGTGMISGADVTDVHVSCTVNTYTVTPSAGANGSITPSTPQVVNRGSTTTFTVTADEGYTAVVGGTCGGTIVDDTYTTNAIIADCTVDATFTLNSYTVTPFTGENGSIAPSTTQIVNHGSTASFTVTADEGYTAVVGGTCGGTLVDDTYTTNAIIADCMVDATFTLSTYTVTPLAGANGSVAPSTPQIINHGSTTTFTVTADDGYTAYIGGTCGGTLVDDTYTTNAVIADCIVIIAFSEFNMYAVNATAGQHGTIFPSGIIYVDHGEIINFTLTADEGYAAVVGGTCGGTLVGDTYTANAIITDCEVTATFTAKSDFPWTMFLPAIISKK